MKKLKPYIGVLICANTIGIIAAIITLLIDSDTEIWNMHIGLFLILVIGWIVPGIGMIAELGISYGSKLIENKR